MVRAVTLEIAKELMNEAEVEAKQRGVKVVITVVNSEGNLISLHRMDGASLASVEISKNKAYSAAALQGPTHEFTEVAEPGGSGYGLHTSDNGRLITFGGGFPLRQNGEIVGAIGVSGASTETDMEIARGIINEFEDINTN